MGLDARSPRGQCAAFKRHQAVLDVHEAAGSGSALVAQTSHPSAGKRAGIISNVCRHLDAASLIQREEVTHGVLFKRSATRQDSFI